MSRKTRAVLKSQPDRILEINKRFPPELGQVETNSYSLTDLGNARRFVRDHGPDVRYCHAWGKWLVWDGKRWAIDRTGEAERRAKRSMEQILLETAGLTDKKEIEETKRWQLKSQAEARIRSAVSLAKSEPGIFTEPGQLDVDPWLLNCNNGTLDLRTGILREHRREDLITKLAPTDYIPQTPFHEWEKFLDRIMAGNRALIAFLQRAVGYALTGDTREQVLFFLHGTGSNGKTKFLETVRAILGDYAKHTDFSAFLQSEHSTARNDLARLAGARFVSASEVQSGRRLSEVVIKQITGGDPVTARFLFHEFFEYTPQCKLFLAVNHRPVIRGTEHAIWRRVRLIPFTVTIPDEQQDKTLGEKLRGELAGILNWAVQGCRSWQEPGLEPPLEVRTATQQYREEMDLLGGFLEACCRNEASAVTTSKELYDAYCRYCAENGEIPTKEKGFGDCLREQGFEHSQKGKRRLKAWKGIRLKTESEMDSGNTEMV